MSRMQRFEWSRRQRSFQSQSSQRHDRRLRIEPLEDRRMLAVITVDSLLDNAFFDGEVTLREAILAANTNAPVGDAPAGDAGADTILFDAALSGQTILLFAELAITETLTIDSTALAMGVTIDAQQTSRIFNFTAATGDFALAGLTLTGGSTNGDNAGSVTTFSGGGIRFLSSGTLALTGSTVSGNSTIGALAYGGGIYTPSGAVTLTHSTLSGNSTSGGFASGGGIYTRSGAVTLTNSTLSGNSTIGALAYGGGIGTRSGAVTLTHSTLSGNSSSYDGGGIRTHSGAVTLTGSTLSGNSSDGAGGGILVTSNPTLTIQNSIVAGNTASGTGPDIRPDSTSTLDVDFSLIGDTNSGLTATQLQAITNGTGNLQNTAPLLGPLANNGGPTQTHALLAGSSVIDAGDPGFDVGATPTDQRGAPFARGVGLRVDMGAVERQTAASLNLTVDRILDENDGDYTAGDLSLREAIGLANGSVGDDTISFDVTVFGTPQTILLRLGEIDISEAVTIDGPGQHLLTIDAQQQSRIFNITATTGDFTLAGLTLTGGQTTGGIFLTDTEFRGGAIRSLTTGSLTIDQSTISGNSTKGLNSKGGGIRSVGNLTLIGSTVSGNYTVGNFSQGGGINSVGNVTITSSTVSGNNTAGNSSHGGGISSGGTVTLISSTVSGNSTTGGSARGGGVDSGGDVTLTYSTVTANDAFATGGGIWNLDDSITIANSIVADNSAGGGSPDINPGTGTFSVNYSLIGSGITPDGDTSGNNVVTNNPLIGPLADNGGPTETHALLAEGLAIDAGDPSIVFNPADFDQRGAPFARVVGGRIDIGAIEDQPTVNSADFDTDGDIDGGDFLAWQRGFGTLTPNATKADGDANNDGDVDDVDLGVWESQFGGPAPAIAATSSPVIETFLAVELSTAFQVEVTAALTSTPEEPLVSSLALPSFLLPDNFIVRLNDPGLGFRFTTPRQELVRAEHPSAEHIDVAFRRDWHSRPEQNRDLISDDFVHTIYEHSARATQPADKAFAELADDEGIVGLELPL